MYNCIVGQKLFMMSHIGTYFFKALNLISCKVLLNLLPQNFFLKLIPYNRTELCPSYVCDYSTAIMIAEFPDSNGNVINN